MAATGVGVSGAAGTTSTRRMRPPTVMTATCPCTDFALDVGFEDDRLGGGGTDPPDR